MVICGKKDLRWNGVFDQELHLDAHRLSMLITYVFCLVICIGKVVSRKARTQTTLPLSPPQSNMAAPSEDNGKVKKDITKLPWRCAHHIRVIYTVNGMLLCLGYGCSSASTPPPFKQVCMIECQTLLIDLV